MAQDYLMSFRPAKETFSREEALDILRRNAALYRNDEGFIDYIAQLAAYLVSHCNEDDDMDEAGGFPAPGAFGLQPAISPYQNPEGGNQLPPTVAQLRAQHSSPQIRRIAPAPGMMPPPGMPPQAPPRPMPYQAPPQNSGSYPLPQYPPQGPPPPAQQPAPAVASAYPPSPLRPSMSSPAVPRPSLYPPARQPTNPGMGQPPTPPPQMPRNPGMPQMPPSPMSGDQYPAPPQGEDPAVGRARVYRVAKTYKGQTSSIEFPCKACGARMPAGTRQCPSCGHIVG